MGESKQRFWAGFDLGGTKMRVAVLDQSWRVVARAEGRTKANVGMRAGVARMATLLNEAWLPVRARKAGATLSGIGLAVPGPVDMLRGIVREMPNVGWTDVPLAKLLGKAAQAPVVVLNDVDAGVFGEYRFGAGRGAECVVGVFPGTGIGGGCVMGGRILSGASSSCMEIGHLPVMPNGPLCGCGQRGCLEAVASRLAIASASAAAAFRGQAPNLFQAVGTDVSAIRSKTLAAAIAAGDEAIEEIVREAANWTGIGVATLVNLLGPDRVVLGGGLVEAMPKFYLAHVADGARNRVMRTYRGTYKLAVAQLGDDAGIRGAAAWASQVVS
jgi:glucokinase